MQNIYLYSKNKKKYSRYKEIYYNKQAYAIEQWFVNRIDCSDFNNKYIKISFDVLKELFEHCKKITTDIEENKILFPLNPYQYSDWGDRYYEIMLPMEIASALVCINEAIPNHTDEIEYYLWVSY